MTLCTDSSRKVWWGRDTQSSRYLEYNRVEKVTWHILRLTAFHAEPHQNEHLEKGDSTRREAVGKFTHVGLVGLAQGCERCRFSTNGKKSMRFFKDSTTRLPTSTVREGTMARHCMRRHLKAISTSSNCYSRAVPTSTSRDSGFMTQHCWRRHSAVISISSHCCSRAVPTSTFRDWMARLCRRRHPAVISTSSNCCS